MFNRKTIFTLTATLAIAFIAAISIPRVSYSIDEPTGTTPTTTCPNFVDLNNDGINDNAHDADGDGIPNCQDADYKRPLDGTGQKNGAGVGNAGKKGNGVGQGKGMGQQMNKGAGKGNKNGTCTGTCTGTGTTGTAKRIGQR